MQNIEKITQILKDYDSELNTNPGSVIQGLLVVPAGEVFDYIQEEKIDKLRSDMSLLTAVDESQRLLLLANFGLNQIRGRKASGKIKVTVSSQVPFYSFPLGTLFTSSSVVLVTTADASITTKDANFVEIPVETTSVSEVVLPIGTTLSSSLYGNLITSAVVTSQIANGKLDETSDALLDRIIEDLSENAMSVSSLRTKVLKEFSSLVDAVVKKTNLSQRYNRPSGVKADIMVKGSLTEKTVSVTVVNGKFTINDIILKVVDSSEVIFLSKTLYKSTYVETNTFNCSVNGVISVSYLTMPIVKDVQSFLDDEDKFPIGVDLIASAATPVFVSSSDLEISESYLYNLPLIPISISKIIKDNNITDFSLPITVYLNDKIMTDKDTFYDFPAYYKG